MKDLRDAMLDAGAPRDDWNAEIPALIAAGQRRVRRRKLIVAGATAAAIAIVGTTAVLAGLPGLNRADPEPVKPDKDRSIFVEERLPVEEVERRCNILLAKGNGGLATEWVAGRDADGRAVAASKSVEAVENRVGRTLEGGPPGTPLPAAGEDPGPEVTPCTIPQESFLDRPPANPTSLPKDSQASLRICSDALGYDVTGWALLASQRARPELVAVIMSANGHAVRCDIDTGFQSATAELLDDSFLSANGDPVLPSADMGPGDPRRYDNLKLRCQTETICMVSGVVWGLPSGHVVELRAPDGIVVARTTVSRGAVAALMKVSSNQSSAITRNGLKVRVLDVDEEPVWTGRIEHVRLILRSQMAPRA